MKDFNNWPKEHEKAFIRNCLERYGSMNKNDYEVMLFHYLLLNDFQDMTDYDISIRLKMPESKVKRLRYEANLVYSTKEENLDNTLLRLLEEGSFKLTSDRIQFSISDKYLRLFLNNKLEKKNHFADSSFNSNIISVTADDLDILINDLIIEKKKRELLIERIKDKIKKSAKSLPKSTQEKILNFSLSIMRVIGGKALDLLVTDSYEELKSLLKKTT
jgi:hypothetical protein